MKIGWGVAALGLAAGVLFWMPDARAAEQPAPVVSADKPSENWEGPKLKPVSREDIFEFDAKPAIRHAGKDRHEISFSVKANCDVSVAIEDKDSRIVRHLVSGVLGKNAPEPFKKDSLVQTVVWDGKNDQKKYVADPENHTVRVSLGLNPTFDRLLAWHPKDTTQERRIGGIVADKDGVYVLNLNSNTTNQLRAYDHDCNYVRTLLPVAADKVNTPELKIPTRTVEDGRVTPLLSGMGGLSPFSRVIHSGALAVGGGKLAMYTTGYRELRNIVRLRTDGATGGESAVGQVLRTPESSLSGPMCMAMSHDGKWVYLSGMGMGTYQDHPAAAQIENTVWRFAWDAEGPIIDKSNPWQGEKARDAKSGDGSGSDDKRFNHPEGIAVDGSGKVHVCDTGNNRIKVFSPDGSLLETIPFQAPKRLGVNHKTGDIYVTSVRLKGRECSMLVTKLGRDRKPGIAIEINYNHNELNEGLVNPLICVDSWCEPVKVWTIGSSGCVRVHADRGDKFELVDDFEKDVRDAGLRPHFFFGSRFNRAHVDPVRGHLWCCVNFKSLFRCDPAGKGYFESVRRVMGQELAFGLDGHLYMRELGHMCRMNPGKLVKSQAEAWMPCDLEFGPDAEVPFEYGEAIKINERNFRGVMLIPALPGANFFDNGIGVAPNGDVYSFVKNYQDWAGMLASGSKYATYIDGNEEKAARKQMSEGYRPKVFPGRTYSGAELLFRWNARGELLEDDLLPSLPMASNGVRVDAAGSIYVGIGASQITEKGIHAGGALAKFAAKGGKFYGMGDSVKLEKKPERTAEFSGDYWTRNMFWSYPGLDQTYGSHSTSYACLCSNARFDTDLFGRSFVPKAYAFTAGVVDTNGNRICEIGRYGNADSGRGPNSPVKIGGPEIALAHCSYLGVHSDRWLYLVDDGNWRIVRVKLGYHAEEKLAVPAAANP
jgi:DNA-binding beta-propeller fold protein YncE